MADNVQLDAMTGGDMVSAYDDGTQKTQRVIVTEVGPINETVFKYCENGGSNNANGNYSGAETFFTVAPGASEVYRIHRMVVTIEDTSGFTAQEYGNLGFALTNGVSVQIRNAGGLVKNLTNGNPVKTNAQWAGLCYDADLKTWGSGDELLAVRWSFDRSGAPLRIDGAAGEYFAISLNDNFSGLVDHHFFLQGIIE